MKWIRPADSVAPGARARAAAGGGRAQCGDTCAPRGPFPEREHNGPRFAAQSHAKTAELNPRRIPSRSIDQHQEAVMAKLIAR